MIAGDEGCLFSSLNISDSVFCVQDKVGKAGLGHGVHHLLEEDRGLGTDAKGFAKFDLHLWYFGARRVRHAGLDKPAPYWIRGHPGSYGSWNPTFRLFDTMS